MKQSNSKKIAIIGAGAVGATTAYTLMLKNLAAEVALIDVNADKEAGEVMDITDGLCYVETGRVTAGTYKDAEDADIVVVTAGAAQKPGETRMDLVIKNKSIVQSIFKEIKKVKPAAIVIIVSNPVDVLTYIIQDLLKIPHAQVFGTGTSLDSARLRTGVGQYLKVNPRSVDGFVLGEHGDSEFVAWSTVSVGGEPIKKLIPSEGALKEIESRVRTEAYEIIKRKGATFYGIALTVADIVEAILFNQHKILPLSTRVSNWNGVSDVCIGAPAVLGAAGIEKVWPLELEPEEKIKFQASAAAIKKYL